MYFSVKNSYLSKLEIDLFLKSKFYTKIDTKSSFYNLLNEWNNSKWYENIYIVTNKLYPRTLT